MPAALCSCRFVIAPALCAASHSAFRGKGVLKGPSAASRSIMAKDASSSGMLYEGDGGGCHASLLSRSADGESDGVTSNVGGARLSRFSSIVPPEMVCSSIDSSSSLMATCEISGGVGVLRLFRRDFDFLVRIPQLFPFFFFLLLVLREIVLTDGGREVSAMPFSDDPLVATAGSAGSTTSAVVSSTEPEVDVRGRIGELLLMAMKGSRLKKDHRLGVLMGLGRPREAPFVAASVDGSASVGIDESSGIELRLRGDMLSASSGVLLCARSSTAPAVLGRDSAVVPLEGIRTIGENASRSTGVRPAEFKEIIDEMLPEPEWPELPPPPSMCRAVIVLAVSFETRDSGRGMNSSVSENPTLARFIAWKAEDCCSDSSGKTKVGVKASCGISSVFASSWGGFGSDPGLLSYFADIGNANDFCPEPISNGLDGALLPRVGWVGVVGSSMSDRSWLEIAAERLWAWPRRPCGGPLGGGPRGLGTGARDGEVRLLSDFVGLILKRVKASPERRLPPTNSLPPRRWPAPAGRIGTAPTVRGECGGLRKEWSGVGGRAAPGLKEKSGRAGDLDGRLSPLLAPPAANVLLSCRSATEFGRLPVARE